MTSAPKGISCRAECKAWFDEGTVVTLTATPDPTSRFAGWHGGDCVGPDACVVTMSQARSITATFADLRPPVDLWSTTPPSPAPDNTPVVSGAAPVGTEVRLYVGTCDGAPIAVGAATDGTFAIEISVASNRTTALRATATDAAGRVSECSPKLSYTEDSTAPPAPEVLGIDRVPAGQPTVLGTAQRGATVRLHSSATCTGDPVGQQVTVTGAFAIPVAATTVGSLFGSARDQAGNLSRCVALSIPVGSSNPPVLAGTVPASGSDHNDPIVVGRSTPGAVVRIFAAAGCAGAPVAEVKADDWGAYRGTVAVADNASLTLSAAAADAAGTMSSCANSVAYREDSATPLPPQLVGTTPKAPANRANPSLHGAAEPWSVTSLYANATCAGAPVSAFAHGGAFGVETLVPEGTSSFAATTTDAAGHTSDCSGPVSYVLDTTPPAAALLLSTLPASPANENAPILTGSADPGSRVDVYIGACGGSPVASAAGGSFSVVVPVPGNQASALRAVAVDAVGNASPCSDPLTYVEDSTPPPAPIVTSLVPLSPANANAPEVRGTTEPGGAVRVLVGEACATATVAAVGNASGDGAFAVSLAVADNTTTTLFVVADDAAGNASDCSKALTYVEDSTLPEAPVLTGTTPPSGSDDNTPAIHGTRPPGTTVRLFRLGGCQGEPFDTFPAGSEAFATKLAVPDDSTTIVSADVVDAAGNASACSNTLTYVEDSGGLSVPVFTRTRPRSSANENRPILEGTVDDDATLEVFAGTECRGAPVATATGASGAFAVEVSVADNSTTAFTARAASGDDSSACSLPISYTEDSLAPSAPMLATISPGRTGNDNAPVFGGTAEPGSIVRTYASSSCLGTALGEAVSDGAFAVVAAVADNSENLIYGVASDQAGNRSPCVLFSDYTEDSLAPALFVSGLSSSGPANDNEPTIGGTTEPGSSVELYYGLRCGGAARLAFVDGAGEFSIVARVGDDTTTVFHLRAVDAAGNASACSRSLSYVEDSTAPQFGGVTSAVGTGPETIDLEWSPATDATTASDDIVYETCLVNEGYSCLEDWVWDRDDTLTQTTAAGATSTTVSQLSTFGQGQLYRAAVRARDTAGNVNVTVVERSVRTTTDGIADAVEAGWHHTCVLAQGRVLCRGENNYGQLGDATTIGHVALTPVVGLLNAVAISASERHTCALVVSGTVSCWGHNNHGQLGDGTTATRRTPVTVSGLSSVVEIDAGVDFTCARRADGSVWCWGSDEYGILGGNGSSTTPVRVIESGVVQLAAGAYHACVIRRQVACWGERRFGQLGDSVREDRTGFATTPQLLVTTYGAVQIEAGTLHTCARFPTGHVSCWGADHFGQLGRPLHDQDPQLVVGLPGPAVGLALGGGHSCAWTSSPRQISSPPAPPELFCWGLDRSRQLGIANPSGDDWTEVPTKVLAGPGSPRSMSGGEDYTCMVRSSGRVRCWGATFSTPGQSQGADLTGWGSPVTASSVSVGTNHTCAVDSVGGAYGLSGGAACWGDNSHGQVGGLWGDRALEPVARLETGTHAAGVDAGSNHGCVLAWSRVSCFGDDALGQRGDGDAYGTALDDARSVSSGLNHSCALRGTGKAYCWGSGGAGRLGNGSTANSDVPVAVDADASYAFDEVAAGGFHTCALSGSSVRCWGSNAYGQLGRDVGNFSSTPVHVEGLSDVVAVTSGTYHSCALLTDGTVRCWGRGSSGQLGGGSTANSMTGVQPALTNVRSIAAGGFSTCAILANGSMKCWGANGHGQLGDGTTTDRLTPRAFAGPAGWLSVDPGANHSCGIRVGGRLYCWGANNLGQLGDGTTTDRLTASAVVSYG